MRQAVIAALAGLAVVGMASAAGFDARTVTVTKTTDASTIVALDGKLTSKTKPCHVGVPVRLDRLQPSGKWQTLRRAHTSTKGLFAWKIVGFKNRARVVVPQVTKSGRICAPVTLGFDRGYLSPG